MAKIPKEEVLKIANLSRIALAENEIPVISRQLKEVLTYAHRVCDSAAEVTFIPIKNVNVFREDVAISNDAKAIVAQAPETTQHYFVVPMVLEAKE